MCATRCAVLGKQADLALGLSKIASNHVHLHHSKLLCFCFLNWPHLMKKQQIFSFLISIVKKYVLYPKKLTCLTFKIVEPESFRSVHVSLVFRLLKEIYIIENNCLSVKAWSWFRRHSLPSAVEARQIFKNANELSDLWNIGAPWRSVILKNTMPFGDRRSIQCTYQMFDTFIKFIIFGY